MSRVSVQKGASRFFWLASELNNGGVMETFTSSIPKSKRYSDGVSHDYAAMLQLWSALNRSITAFDRKCGMKTITPIGHKQLPTNAGKKSTR